MFNEAVHEVRHFKRGCERVGLTVARCGIGGDGWEYSYVTLQKNLLGIV